MTVKAILFRKGSGVVTMEPAATLAAAIGTPHNTGSVLWSCSARTGA